MAPSAPEITKVEVFDMREQKTRAVGLKPMEAVAQAAYGVDFFQREGVSPQAVFYFPETAVTDEKGASLPHHVSKAAIFGLNHPSMRSDFSETELLVGRDYRGTLQASYKTRMRFTGDSLWNFAIQQEDGTEARLFPPDKAKDKSKNRAWMSAILWADSLKALLALNGKGQAAVLGVAAESGICQLDYKAGVHIGDKTYLAKDNTRPLAISFIGAHDFEARQMAETEHLDKDKPYFVAVSGPQATFADFVKELRPING